MPRSIRRLLTFALALALLIVASALAYKFGMSSLEGEERSFLRSLEWAAETLSTTGYGGDASWSHPLMVIFVVMLQFVGVFLIFLLFPIYLIPALEERFQARLPREAPRTDNCILVLRYGVAVSTLIEEIESEGLRPLIVESDPTVARGLMEEGRHIVLGSPEGDVFSRIDLKGVRGVVANGNDDENAAAILSLRQRGYEGDIFALAEEPYHRKPLAVAGATGVFTPRHILAAALAARASDRISPRVRGAQVLGEHLVVSEIKIGESSQLVGSTLRASDIGHTTRVNVIGLWIRGQLIAPPDPDQALEAGTILVAAGTEANLNEFAQRTTAVPLRKGKPFFVAGYGEVGKTVARMLRSVGEDVTTLDRRALEGVDLVADIADHQTLASSPLRECQAAILAVGSDSATLFATLMVKEFAPEVPIIARVNDIANVERIHRAGADFALSISQVSGQLLAARLLHRESLAIDKQLRLVKAEVTHLVGRHPNELEIRRRTGASVVAAESNGDILVEFDDDYSFSKGDIVYVAGSHEATQAFLDTFGGEA